MNQDHSKDRPGADPGRQDPARTPEPWHAADEKRSPGARKGGGAPIGTHSLTGAGATVGMPASPKAARGEPERGDRRDDAPGAEEPVPLAEPRATGGDLLGRKR